MDKHLRLFAGQVVVESKISKAAKLQLLNFIKEEASDTQIKALLLDGEIVHLDEQAEEVVNDRFSVSEAGGKVAQMRKTYFGVSALGGLWLLYRAIRSRYDICTKRCGTLELNTARRQYCMAKCKIEKVQKELQAAMSKKNPKEIAKKKLALAKAKETFANYQKSFAGKEAPTK